MTVNENLRQEDVKVLKVLMKWEIAKKGRFFHVRQASLTGTTGHERDASALLNAI